MENATKALVIAATVLIAVMIISIGVYVFLNYSKVADDYNEEQASQHLVAENMKFEKYIDKTLTIQDVVTMMNLAKDYNNGRPVSSQIAINFNGHDIAKSSQTWTDMLTNDISNPIQYYNIKNIDYYGDGTIKTINIAKKP